MKKVKVSPKGRTCKTLHCRTILSIYNHDYYCSVHQDRYGSQMALKTAKI